MKDFHDMTEPQLTEFKMSLWFKFEIGVRSHLADGKDLAQAINQTIDALYLELKHSEETAAISGHFLIEFRAHRRELMGYFAQDAG